MHFSSSPSISLFRFIIMLVSLTFISACSTRDIQSKFSGSTAQRLITHSIDDLVSKLEDKHLDALKGQSVFINSYFLEESPFKLYADKRLALELEARFGATVVATQAESNQVMTVFYTSLATDFDNFGIQIPLGYSPAADNSTSLNIITLEKFHGVSEMYYYIGPTGTENRSEVIHAKVKTDALGLPFITIPLSTVDRHDSWF